MQERTCCSDVVGVTDEFGHEGTPEETFEMKKSLLATVAAVALIAGAGFASAEGAKEQSGKEQSGMKAGDVGQE